jgi:hypothetical protein
MYKAASRKIGIFLTGLILLACAVIVTPSICRAGMNELSDGELSSVLATGFSSFTITPDGGDPTISYAKMSFNTTVSTYTTIDTLKMGYYTKGTLGWDNAWTGVSLGTSSADLVFDGVYIEAKFKNITDSSTRQLEYLRIGTPKLTGDISANFGSFTGDIGATSYIRQSLGAGTKTITSPGTGTDKGFYLSLDRTGGYSFHFGSDSHL